MRNAPVFLIAACLTLLALASPVQGAFVPWQYNWSRNPAIMYSDSSSTSYVTLSDQPLASAVGSSDIVATNLKVFSNASPGSPATFTNKAYTLTLFLLDVNSSQSGTLKFTGIINGNVSSESSNLQNQFTGTTKQELDLGQHRYTVTIGPFTPPGPPGSANTGAIGAHAMVQITDIQKTPEPSTLVLALLGAPVISFRVWRYRRKGSPLTHSAATGSALAKLA
jgi:hypothetical protein